MKYKTKYWKQESNWINLEIVTHSNLPPEWFDTISEEIQGACSLKTSNFSLISPLIWHRKTTNWSIKKKEEIKIFVSQSFPHHYWVSLKVEAVSLLAHFSFTGLASCPVWVGGQQKCLPTRPAPARIYFISVWRTKAKAI